jgi:hypothetical protein
MPFTRMGFISQCAFSGVFYPFSWDFSVNVLLLVFSIRLSIGISKVMLPAGPWLPVQSLLLWQNDFSGYQYVYLVMLPSLRWLPVRPLLHWQDDFSGYTGHLSGEFAIDDEAANASRLSQGRLISCSSPSAP